MNTKDIKPMSQKEYRETNDCVCPFCRCDDLEVGVIKIDEVGVYQLISCKFCNAIWEDNYKLIGYTVKHKPQEDKNAKDRGYSECPFCQNKNIVGTKEATIEGHVIMQDSICSDCRMTFATKEINYK